MSVAGSIPVLGAVPDAIDLVYTGIEVPFGKSSGTDLGLAAAGLGASFLPGIDQGIGIAKVTTRIAAREAGILAAPIAKSMSGELLQATVSMTEGVVAKKKGDVVVRVQLLRMGEKNIKSWLRELSKN